MIGLRTNSEEERATTKRCRRRMDCLVKNRDEQLHDIKIQAKHYSYGLTFIFLKKISKSLSTSAGVIRPVVIISGTFRLSMRILRRPRWATGPAFVCQRIIRVVGPSVTYQVRSSPSWPPPAHYPPQDQVVGSLQHRLHLQFGSASLRSPSGTGRPTCQ